MTKLVPIVAVAIVALACGKRGDSEPQTPPIAPGSAAAVAGDASGGGSTADATATLVLDAAVSDGAPVPSDAVLVDAGVAGNAAPADTSTLLAVASVDGALVAVVVSGAEPAEATRVVVHGERGSKICEATVGARSQPSCARQPWFALVADGACSNPIYARAPGQPFTTAGAKATVTEQQAAVETWFTNGPLRIAEEAVTLNGLSDSFLPTLVSSRVVAVPGAEPLVLAYVRAPSTSGPVRRSIYALKLAASPLPDSGTLEVVDEIEHAPAPSRVAGSDLDGDGWVDVIVSHAAGVAVLFSGNRTGLEAPCS